MQTTRQKKNRGHHRQIIKERKERKISGISGRYSIRSHTRLHENVNSRKSRRKTRDHASENPAKKVGLYRSCCATTSEKNRGHPDKEFGPSR